MADIVQILINGEWTEKKIHEIQKELWGLPMRCCGKNDLGPCHAHMQLAFRGGKPYTFYQAHRNESVHVVGCEHDRRSKKSRIERFDMRCADLNSRDLLQKMSQRKEIKKRDPKGKTGGDGGDGDTDRETSEETRHREVEDVARRPSSPEGLAEVFEALPVRSPIMEGYVFDFVVDHRTLEYYRANGIPEDTPVLTLMKKTVAKHRYVEDPKQWEIILASCDYDASNDDESRACLRYRVREYHTRQKLMELMRKKDSENYYLVMFGCWEKDSVNPNTYIAVGETEGVVGRIKIDKCQTPSTNE